MDSFTTFSQYKYVRPDFEETKKLIRIAVESMKKAESKDRNSCVLALLSLLLWLDLSNQHAHIDKLGLANSCI